MENFEYNLQYEVYRITHDDLTELQELSFNVFSVSIRYLLRYVYL